MITRFLSASVATAVLFTSMTPAFAQSYGFDSVQAPRGATATINFRMPLGFAPREQKASYGLTFGFGRQLDSVASNGRPVVREAQLADIRFTGNLKLAKADVASFDLANLGQDPRLHMGPSEDGKDTTWLWVGGAVLVGVAVCVAAHCFGHHHHHNDTSL